MQKCYQRCCMDRSSRYPTECDFPVAGVVSGKRAIGIGGWRRWFNRWTAFEGFQRTLITFALSRHNASLVVQHISLQLINFWPTTIVVHMPPIWYNGWPIAASSAAVTTLCPRRHAWPTHQCCCLGGQRRTYDDNEILVVEDDVPDRGMD